MSLLQNGAGTFYFDDPVRAARVAVRDFCPSQDLASAPIVIAMHGLDRNAKDVRDAMALSCAKNGQILLVPEFDAIQFPGIASYNFGGAAPNLPLSAWTFPVIDRLFEYIRSAIGSNRERFGLFGISAGAQFVLRYMALMNAEPVEAAVASNCGVYMRPDLTLAYPDGMGGLGHDQSTLRRYLGHTLVLLIGSEDSNANAHDLPRSEKAMTQGPHRLARAQWYAAHCDQLARKMQTPFNWILETVPGAGHVSQENFDRAAEILKEMSSRSG